MEQHITKLSETREEAVGRGCGHGPSVALVNPAALCQWLGSSPCRQHCSLAATHIKDRSVFRRGKVRSSHWRPYVL